MEGHHTFTANTLTGTSEPFAMNVSNNSTVEKAKSNGSDAQFWITVAYVVIGLFGLFGNAFVFVVISQSKKMRKNVINKLILYQSSLDCMAAFWILITCNIRYGVVRPDDSLKEQILCILWTSKLVMWALFLASTFNLVIITLERYIAMVHPLSHKRMTPARVYAMMAIPTVIAFVFQIAQISATSGVLATHKKCVLLEIYPNNYLARCHILFSASFQFYIPMVIMIFAYGHIFIVLRQKSRERIQTTGQDHEGHRSGRLRTASLNVLKTLVLVCILFFICWVGNTSSFVLLVFGVTPEFLSTSWYHISTCLCFVNCAVNPFVYSLQYREFKMAARAVCCSFKTWSSDATEMSSTSASKSTSTTN